MYVDNEGAESKRRIILRRRRITWYSILGVVVITILVFCLYQFTDVVGGITRETTSSPGSGEWTMFRHDLTHTGVMDPGSVQPEGKLKWTFQAGDAIHSSPAVVDGVVYFGSRDHNIYAVDADTGEEIWSYQTGSWVESSPAVVDGVLYCGSNDGRLYALDATTGMELWSFRAQYSVRSSPAIADGVAYFGSDDYSVYAVDIDTGQEIWRTGTKGTVLSSPVVIDGVVIVGSVSGSCYVLNGNNGRVRLNFDTRSSIVTSPIACDGIAYITTTAGNIYAIDYGARNWPFENTLKIFWEVLYIRGGAPRPPTTSGYVWMHWLGRGIRTSSSVAMYDGTLYLGCGYNLMAIKADDQQELWTYQAIEPVVSSPAVTDSAVYFGSNDGNLYAVERAKGVTIWQYATDDKIESSPTVADGCVYVGSFDGKMYAFE
jgi:outer membrane protein assembly factor BamB